MGRELTNCVLSIPHTLPALTAGGQDEIYRIATVPSEHYRQAILCSEAHPWAQRYLVSVQADAVHDVLAAVPLHLQPSVQLIAEAVQYGWFVVRNGKDGTFSARQFAARCHGCRTSCLS